MSAAWIKSWPRFQNPLKPNGCVPNAWGHVGELDAEQVARLATIARRERLLTARNVSTGATRDERLKWWARHVAVRILTVRTYLKNRGVALAGEAHGSRYTLIRKRPTVARFARQHQRGRFVLFVRGHALALVDGVLLGDHNPRSIVCTAVRVERGL